MRVSCATQDGKSSLFQFGRSYTSLDSMDQNCDILEFYSPDQTMTDRIAIVPEMLTGCEETSRRCPALEDAAESRPMETLSRGRDGRPRHHAVTQ